MLTEQKGIQVDKFYPPMDWQYSFPEGYTRLEYLESTGTQYIDTGVKCNQDTTVVLDCFYNARKNTDRFFGDYSYENNAAYRSFIIGHNTSINATRLFASYGTQSYYTDVDYSQRCVIKLAKNKLYFNDTLLKTFNEETSFTTVNNALLFNSRANNVNGISTLKVYSCQIYDNGTLVHNFVPVLRKSDNELGMLDLVEGKFYPNTGTGEFVMGPELYSNNSQIDIRQKNNTNFVEKYKFNENNELIWANPQLNLSGHVGYTKIGNPMIVDNVASGFSSGNYIQLSESAPNLDINSKFELILKLKFNDFNQAIFGGSNTYNIYISIDSSKRLYAYVYDNTNGNRIYAYIWSSALDDTPYWIKYLIENGKLSIAISNDNTNWHSSSIDLPQNFKYTLNSILSFKSDFQGSIDLKETYIKVNDKLWFYGKNYTSENYAPVPAGLNYNNTTTPSIGYVNTQTQEFIPAPTDGIKYSQTRDIKVIPPEDNTITLLYGVKSDFSKYALFGLLAQVSSGTYDVYIDDVLYATTASGTQTDIDFSTLGDEYVSIGTATTPESLVLHKVVIKPTTSGATISAFRSKRTTNSGYQSQGILWCHFELDNYINITECFMGYTTNYNQNIFAVTSKDILYVNNFSRLFGTVIDNQNQYGVLYLKYMPKIKSSVTSAIGSFRMGVSNGNTLKKIELNVPSDITGNGTFTNSSVEKIYINKKCSFAINSFLNVKNLKLLPSNDMATANMANTLTNGTSLYPTKLDGSKSANVLILGTYGTSTYPMRGLRGLKVSNEAPFSGSSPQIDVSYTGLDRDALVELFNSLPTVTGSQTLKCVGATGNNLTKVGSPTIDENGVASGFKSYPNVNSGYYLRVNNFTYNDTFEIKMKIRTGSEDFNGVVIGQGNQTPKAGIVNTSFRENNYSLGLTDENNQSIINVANINYIDSKSLTLDTDYILTLKFTGSEYIYTLVDMNGIYYINRVISTTAKLRKGSLAFGIHYVDVAYSAWSGAIYLEDTYIKTDRNYLMKGYLLDADKNIALNKGWSLTLS